MITVNADVCAKFDTAREREWVESNGLGGYASSTVAGANTRRYHGLLVAAVHPPVGRFVLLSKLEEVLIASGKRYELSANQYPGVVHPQGFRYLKQFCLDPFPVFTFHLESVEIEKANGIFKGSHIQGKVRRIRMLGPEYMMVDLDLQVSNVRQLPPGSPAYGDRVLRNHLKHILEKRNGAWKVIAAQNTFIANAAH